MCRLIFIVLLAAALMGTRAPIAHAEAEAVQAGNAAQTAADVLAQPSYQSNFPSLPGEPAPSEPASNTSPLPDSSFGGDPGSNSSPDAIPAAPAGEPAELAPPQTPIESGGSGIDMRYVLLGAVILGFVILAVYLRRRMSPRQASSTTSAPRPPAPVIATIRSKEAAPEPVRQPGPLDEAERLAAAGRFSEAIHLILLRFLAELRHWANLTIADSLTSREILRKDAVPPPTREALGILIGAVELCHFGGRRGDEKLFRHCADTYHAAAVWRRSSTVEGA